MLFLKNQNRVLLTVVASLGLSVSGVFALAQDDVDSKARPMINQDSNTQEPSNTSKSREVLLKARVSDDGTDLVVFGVVDTAETLESLTTLEEVRAMRISESVKTVGTEGGGEGLTGGLGDLGYGAAGAAMGMPGGAGGGYYAGMGLASPPDARQIAMQKINQLRSKLASPDEDRAEVEKQLRSALSEYFIADLQHRIRELDAVKARVQEMEARLQKRLDLKQEAIDLQLKRMQHEADGLEFVVPNDPGGSGAFGGDMPGGMGGGIPGSAGGSSGSAAGYPGAAGGTAPGLSGGPGTAPPRAKGK